jgi:hypothetical protein
VNAGGLAGIRWRRGATRLWIVISVLWCVVTVSIAATSTHVAWPWTHLTTIHVKISNTETWDYPAEWGDARITEDLTKRLADLDKQDREWAAKVPAVRKAECSAIPSTVPFSGQPQDCVRLFLANDSRAVPEDWRMQLLNMPVPIGRAATEVLPWVLGPPLLLLILGAAFTWVLSGFRQT